VKYRIIFALILLLIVWAKPSQALACSPGLPIDKAIVTQDGKYTLVVLQSSPENYPVNQNIRDKYSQSGLYSEANPSSPLWTVDLQNFLFLSLNVKIYPSSNGKYLVIVSRSNGVTFFENGKKTKQYELAYFRATIPLGSCATDWFNNASLNSSGHLVVETADNKNYEFDISSGQLNINLSAVPAYIWLFGIFVVVGALLVLHLNSKRLNKGV